MKKLQNRWYVFDEMTLEEKKVFNSHPTELIMVLYDNGDILRFNEDSPFAELIQVFLLPDTQKL